MYSLYKNEHEQARLNKRLEIQIKFQRHKSTQKSNFLFLLNSNLELNDHLSRRYKNRVGLFIKDVSDFPAFRNLFTDGHPKWATKRVRHLQRQFQLANCVAGAERLQIHF